MSPNFPPEFEDDDATHRERAEDLDSLGESPLLRRMRELTAIGILGHISEDHDTPEKPTISKPRNKRLPEETIKPPIDVPTEEAFSEQDFIRALHQKIGLTEIQASYVASHFRRTEERKKLLEEITESAVEFFTSNPEVLEIILPDKHFSVDDGMYSRNQICSPSRAIETDAERRGRFFAYLVSIFNTNEVAKEMFLLMSDDFLDSIRSEFSFAEEENESYKYALANSISSVQHLLYFSNFIEQQIATSNFNSQDIARFLKLISFGHTAKWESILSRSGFTLHDYLSLAEHENGRLLLKNPLVIELFLWNHVDVITPEKLFSVEFLQETELIEFFAERTQNNLDIHFKSSALYNLDMLPWEKRLRLLEALLRVRDSAGVLQEELDMVLFSLYKSGKLPISAQSGAAAQFIAELDACDTFPEDNPLLLRKLRNVITNANNLSNEARRNVVKQLRDIVISLKEKQGLSTEYIDDDLIERITKSEHRLSPLRWITPTWGYEVEYTEPTYSHPQKPLHTFLQNRLGINMGEGDQINDTSLELSPGPFASVDSGVAVWDLWYHGQLIDIHSLYNQTLHWNIALRTQECMSILVRLTHLAGRAYDTSTYKDSGIPDEEADPNDTHTLIVRAQSADYEDLTGTQTLFFESKDGRVVSHEDFRTALSEVPVLAMAAKAFEEVATSFQAFGSNGEQVREMMHDIDEDVVYVCFKLMTESDIFEFAQSDYQARLALIWKQFYDAANQGLDQIGLSNYLRKAVPRVKARRYSRTMRKVFPNNEARYDPESINRTWEGSSVEYQGTEYPNIIAFIRSLTEETVAELNDIRTEIFSDFELILEEIAENWQNPNKRSLRVNELFATFPWMRRLVDESSIQYAGDDDVEYLEWIEAEIYLKKEALVFEMIQTFIDPEFVVE